MMYVEKHKIVDLVPDTMEGLKSGLFKDFGFVVGDYFGYRGFTSDSTIEDIRGMLEGEILIAASITNNTTLNDIKDWLRLNEGASIVVIDFHILEPTQEKDDLLDRVESMLDESMHNLQSYENRFAFCKMADILS